MVCLLDTENLARLEIILGFFKVQFIFSQRASQIISSRKEFGWLSRNGFARFIGLRKSRCMACKQFVYWCELVMIFLAIGNKKLTGNCSELKKLKWNWKILLLNIYFELYVIVSTLKLDLGKVNNSHVLAWLSIHQSENNCLCNFLTTVFAYPIIC